MKIGICGTMSIGKTFLVNALQATGKFPNYNFSTERSKYLNDLGIPLNTDSTLKGQVIFLAERCAELINENVITDRTIIDVMAFTSVSESIEYYEKEKFIDLASILLKEYDYIFYISPEGISMEDNGVRSIDLALRKDIDDIIQYNLKVYKSHIKNLHTIKGTTEERISQILNVIKE